MSLFVGAFIIFNTFSITVSQRTREFGLLRTRRQVRQMVRYESVITALIGAVLGLLLGMILALVSAAAVAGQGFVLSIPVATLVLRLVLAGAAGVGAAAWPARRAAQVELLEALATQLAPRGPTRRAPARSPSAALRRCPRRW